MRSTLASRPAEGCGAASLPFPLAISGLPIPSDAHRSSDPRKPSLRKARQSAVPLRCPAAHWSSNPYFKQCYARPEAAVRASSVSKEFAAHSACFESDKLLLS